MYWNQLMGTTCRVARVCYGRHPIVCYWHTKSSSSLCKRGVVTAVASPDPRSLIKEGKGGRRARRADGRGAWQGAGPLPPPAARGTPGARHGGVEHWNRAAPAVQHGRAGAARRADGAGAATAPRRAADDPAPPPDPPFNRAQMPTPNRQRLVRERAREGFEAGRAAAGEELEQLLLLAETQLESAAVQRRLLCELQRQGNLKGPKF
jgi:hypothetical protein